MPFHTVKQGEHLSRIAEENGFSGFQTIWDHPENAALKKKRENPNVLFPGDELFIPEKEVKEEAGSTEKRHRFVCKQQLLMLRIVIRNIDDQPIANSECELTLDLEVHHLTTDGTGLIEQPIPATAETGKLKIGEMEFPLKIGHLDPVEETSGERARLNNLGYFAGFSTTDQKQLKWAVEEFQYENKIKPVNGVYDVKTQTKLKETYGC